MKIGDFGESRILDLMKYIGGGDVFGTPLFTAPEIFKNEKYDHWIDVWALGCIIFQLACLDLPFTKLASDELKQ